MTQPAPIVTRALSWLIAVLIPFFLLMTSIRILINPLFVQIEYRTPNFPEDPYGFNLQDRLKWASISVDYLINNAGIEYLASQRLPDGAPLYNDRELSHMLDVKKLVQAMIVAWWILVGVLFLLGMWAWRAGWLYDYRLGASRGGWITIGLIALILVGVALSFRTLFTDFHRIFFQGDTWLFLYSDSLIRLFPMRFWQDCFIWMGGMTILFAGLLGYFGRNK